MTYLFLDLIEQTLKEQLGVPMAYRLILLLPMETYNLRYAISLAAYETSQVFLRQLSY